MADGSQIAAWDHTASILASWGGGKPQEHHPYLRQFIRTLGPKESLMFLAKKR